jgi:iron complex transport system ATP-binding protein
VPGPESDRVDGGPEPGLAVSEVTAGYAGRPVLRGVSLTAFPGEVTGLIGPNGSGKTTFVRVVSRGLAPRAGTVTVNGRDPYTTSAREAAKVMAVVPQEVVPAFSYTVLELVLMGRAPYRSLWGGGGDEDWARARWAMQAASVQHLADRPYEELSAGERQRVILAQALAQDAPVLLLDEPTTHLDVRHVVEILAVVRGLARTQAKTVVAVFHDLNLASAYCDRIHAMDAGRVVASGPPASVLTGRLVREVFGVEADVSPTGPAGRPSVLVGHSPALLGTGLGGRRAHVMGGAGRGGGLLRGLLERGFQVTTGVLHAGDTDEAVAERLTVERVAVPPFSGIDDRSADDCWKLIQAADLLVVCDAPFGPGNVENLRLAVRAARGGIRTILVEQVPIEERDFTGGEATRLWRWLGEAATVVRGSDELFRAVLEESASGSPGGPGGL